MGFLFQKPSETTKVSGSRALKGTYVIKTSEPRPSNIPQMNSFTIPASDTVELPRPKPRPEPEPELEPRPDPLPSSSRELQPDIGEAAVLVHQIREALLPQGDFLSIPAEAVLAHLPEELRGPAWPGDTPTGTNLMMDKETLLEKLRTGTITYPLGEFLPDMLEGWVVDDPTAEVVLDLPTVVKAIPSELFGSATTGNAVAAEAMEGRDYFTPAQASEPPPPAEPTPAAAEEVSAQAIPPLQPLPPVQPVQPAMPEPPPAPSPAPEPVPAPEPAPAPSVPSGLFGTGTGPKRQVVPTRIPGAWNGIELPCGASVGAVDINAATLDQLQALPGIGPDRARMILDDRAKRGTFDGIYDLLRIRGIGRKRFCHLTGLSLRRRDRRDRHEVLNELIGLPADSRPGLGGIVEQIAATFAGGACTLVTHDGVVLASSANAENDIALRAAMVPMLFRRTGRYLRDLAPGASDCVALPISDPPLLLFAVDRYFLMLELPDRESLQQAMPAAIAVAQELTWLMGPRAMVRQAEGAWSLPVENQMPSVL